jgi:hypothetical protein
MRKAYIELIDKYGLDLREFDLVALKEIHQLVQAHLRQELEEANKE